MIIIECLQNKYSIIISSMVLYISILKCVLTSAIDARLRCENNENIRLSYDVHVAKKGIKMCVSEHWTSSTHTAIVNYGDLFASINFGAILIGQHYQQTQCQCMCVATQVQVN